MLINAKLQTGKKGKKKTERTVRSPLRRERSALDYSAIEKEEEKMMMISMEHWWNDADRGKPKYWEKILPHCHSVHHKSHGTRPGMEPGSPR